MATRIEALLGSDAARPALRAGLFGPEQAIRRASMAVARASRNFGLVREALLSTDVEVRVHAARCLLAELAQAEAGELALKLIHDRFGRVRYDALKCLAERCPDRLEGVLEESLLDSSSSVNQFAGFCARTRYDFDLAAHYRACLPRENVRELAVALGALARVGGQQDANLFLDYSEHPTIRVQAAALAGLAMADAGAHAEVFVRALQSPFVRVSRMAREVLRGARELADREILEACMLSSAHSHVRLNSLILLCALGKWERLRCSLLALESGDSDLREHAESELRSWRQAFNRSWTEPSAAELQQIRQLLVSMRDLIHLEQIEAYLPG